VSVERLRRFGPGVKTRRSRARDLLHQRASRGAARVAALRRDDGQTVIEFALVAIPLLIILFGIVQFGLAWNRKNDAVHLANEAARMAAVNNVNCGQLKTEANSNGVSGGTITITPQNGGVTGAPVTASVSNVPVANVVPNLIPGIPNSVGASATMRLEQAFASTVTCPL
jgi:Flp pilus assembly protein TadG